MERSLQYERAERFMDTPSSLRHCIPSHWVAHKTTGNENCTHHQPTCKKSVREDRRAFATQRSYRASIYAVNYRIPYHVDRYTSSLGFLEFYYTVSRKPKKHDDRSYFDNSTANLCHCEHGKRSKGEDRQP